MQVKLESYLLETTDEGVAEYSLANYSAPYRLTTEDQRNALMGTSNWVQKFHGGFGRVRCPPDDPYNDAGKFYDSRCETRFSKFGYVYPSILQQTPTLSATGDTTNFYFWDYADFRGQLYSLSASNTDDNSAMLNYARKFTGSTAVWTYTGAVSNGAYAWNAEEAGYEAIWGAGSGDIPPRGFLQTMGSYLVAHVVSDTDVPAIDILVYTSTDGATFTATGAANTAPIGRVAYATGDKPGPVISIGGTWIITYYDQSAGAILVYKSTDSAANVTLIDTVISQDTCKGLALWTDVDGNDRIWMKTKENYGWIDVTATSGAYHPLANTPGEGVYAFGVEAWNGDLYVGHGEGVDKCTWSGGVLYITNIGLNSEGPIPYANKGYCIDLHSTPQWLWMLYGGLVASQQAGVYAWDGNGWHFGMLYGTANKRGVACHVSSNEDAISRLHVAFATSTTITALKHLNYILDNPETVSGSMEFNTGSSIYINTCVFDTGMPEISGSALRLDMAAVSLSATTSGQYISTNYSTVSTTTPGTALGNFLSGTLTLPFGSGAGTEAKEIWFLYVFYRDATTTNCAKMIYPVLKFKKKPTTRWARVFTVDVEETIKMFGITMNEETLITNLKTLKDTQTLSAFSFGQQTASYVEIAEIQFNHRWTHKDGQYMPEPRKGYIAVRVETAL